MGGDAKNGAGAERLHAWGRETDHGETAAERMGRKMVLPFLGGGHEGSRFSRRTEVYKQKLEHGRAIHCNTTASGPLQGDDIDRRGEGDNEVVGPEGDRLGESKSEGSGDEIRIRPGDRHGRGGGTELRQWGERLERGGMEWSKCRPMGSKCKLVIYYIRTDYSEWVAAVLGLENHPIMSKLSGHGDRNKRKKVL